MPKAAATPAATIPDPYSRPTAIMVAAAALDETVDTAEEVDALVDALVDVGVLVLLAEEEEEGAAATKLAGSM
jgi:hypothetical protein